VFEKETIKMPRQIWMITLTLALSLGCAGAKKKDDPCRNPEYVQVKKDTITDSLARQDLYTALEAGMDAYRCDPEDPEVNYWLGWIYMHRDQYDKALDYLNKALEYQKEYPEANMALGMIYLRQDRLDEAIAQFKSAAENDLFRNAFEAYNNLGWIYLLKGDLEGAEKKLNLALKLNPNWCISHCNLGEVYLGQGKKEQGLASLKKATELCPQYARPHLLLGIEYNRDKKIPEACQEFNAAYNADLKSEEGQKAGEYLNLLNCKRVPKNPTPSP
jgi:tetratricopeptide (TPR) repeat protein